MKEDMEQMQHLLNPLHIYCRLIEQGYSKPEALMIANVYEQVIYKPIIIESLKQIHGEDHERFFTDIGTNKEDNSTK